MRSQTTDLNSRGISTLYLGDVQNDSVHIEDEDDEVKLDVQQKCTLHDLYNGRVHILFASPESLLSKAGRNVLKRIGPQMVKCLAVDEAHCVKKYGHANGKKKRAFRPQYRQLHQIRATLPGVPCIALTATATPSTTATIIKDLALVDCQQIHLSPHKENIKYTVVKVGKATDYEQNLRFLVDLILERGITTPRILVFFRQMSHLTGAYEYLDYELGKNGYINYQDDGPNDDRNHLIEMFVMKTDEVVKENIVKTFMNPHGHIRVVFCSSSFSMGLNLRNLDTVLHYGIPTDLDDYLQQTGRAGRDENQEAHAVVLYHSDALKGKNTQKSMKEFVKSVNCRRVQLYKDYVGDIAPLVPGHSCCDNCAKLCDCCDNCTLGTCDVIDQLMKDKDSTSDESVSEGAEFHSTSSSDIEYHRQRKPQVLEYSTESD